MTTANIRGWPVIFDGEWVYQDTGEPISVERPCRHCGRWPDTCLGELPGVLAACCGHGDRKESYILFENGLIIKDFVVDQNLFDSRQI